MGQVVKLLNIGESETTSITDGMVRITIRINDQTLNKIKPLAEASGCSPAEYVFRVLKDANPEMDIELVQN